MSFASPLFLAGLVVVPVAVFLYVRAERRPHRFAPAALMPSIVARRSGWRRHAALAGYGAAVAALLVALAKPQATVAVPTAQSVLVKGAGDLQPGRERAAVAES